MKVFTDICVLIVISLVIYSIAEFIQDEYGKDLKFMFGWIACSLYAIYKELR